MSEEREDVEATLQQDTAPDISQQKRKWRAIDWIAGGTFIAEVLWGSWWLVTQFFHWCSWSPNEYVDAEHFPQFYCGVGLGILSVGYLTLILWPIVFNIFKQGKDSKQDNDPRWFHARILSSGIVGGSYAFLLPAVMSLPEGGVNSGGAAALRQAILLATGGLIGLIALGETRRKNDNDREAAENLRDHQQDMLNQQKKQLRKQIKKQQQQFEANAFKERKAERRERYTKAVEQLGDEKAPIRMGGVYTLVGLVDEWLEEENLSELERFKEGQVIINNLCAYIRSPFTLASHYDELSNPTPTPKGIYKDKKEKFYADKATLDSETDVRLSIIKEIHDRIQGPDKNTPGAWSDFEYDFSGSTFFYPVDLTKSYYTKPINFSGSTYRKEAYFSRSTYQGEAYFSRSTYQGEAYFTGSTYEGWAYFSGSTYQNLADFTGSTYNESEVNFSGSTYEGEADFTGSTYNESEVNFHGSTYKGVANFSGSTYEGEADFRGSTYEKGVTFSTSYFSPSTYVGEANFSGSTYQGWADFSGSTYEKGVTFSTSYFSPSTYVGEANFSGSTYTGKANFSGSTYLRLANFEISTYQWANFSDSIYCGKADFIVSTYQWADFSGSIFYQEIYFGEVRGSSSLSRFTECAPIFYKENFYGKNFYEEIYNQKTLFGSLDNNFTTENGRGYPIYRNFEGLPLGCKFLASEQKEYLADKFQEIEETKNKLREVKDPKEKAELLKKLRSLNEELHKWREKVTTVKVEDGTIENTES